MHSQKERKWKPRGYWADIQNRRDYFGALASRLGINAENPEEWKKVSYEQLGQANGLLKKYRGNLKHALSASFPELDFSVAGNGVFSNGFTSPLTKDTCAQQTEAGFLMGTGRIKAIEERFLTSSLWRKDLIPAIQRVGTPRVWNSSYEPRLRSFRHYCHFGDSSLFSTTGSSGYLAIHTLKEGNTGGLSKCTIFKMATRAIWPSSSYEIERLLPHRGGFF